MINKKYAEYDMVRVLAIFLVVIGHCDFLTSQKFTVEETISNNLSSFLFFQKTVRLWIYSFHMQLFMILSGVLYSLVRKKYSIKQYIINRTKRLIIPFYVCGIFFSFPIKYLCGYFGNESVIKAFFRSIVLVEVPGHLWFLFVLFVISIIIAFLVSYIEKRFGDKKISLYRLILIVLFIITFLQPTDLSYFQYNRILHYMFYYYLGFYIGENGIILKITALCLKTKILCCSVLFALMCTVLFFYNNEHIDLYNRAVFSPFINIVLAICGCNFTFLLSSVLVRYDVLENRAISSFHKNSFNVYLYHEPIQFVLLYILKMVGILSVFNSNTGFIILVMLRLIISIILSVLIGEIILNFKSRLIQMNSINKNYS